MEKGTKRSIVILGSTGSIGVNTFRVVDQYPNQLRVTGLVGGDNIDLLAKQVNTYRPELVSTKTVEGANRLKELLGKNCKTEIGHGVEGAEEVARKATGDIVLSAIVGSAGLRPTLAAIRAQKTIALANKETMVVAGALVRREAEEHQVTILPVDSEHNAIFQALAGAKTESVRRLILTASGGPFFKKPDLDLSNVTVEEALAHPNWKMGEKITIDSATMMNKGLEIIEARWLFGFPTSQIDVVVHPQSVIHSMVEYVDGSILAQMGVPDMRGPIAYALTYPERLAEVTERLSLSKIRELTFFDPDSKRFPSVNLARKALESGETHPAVLNGSNEVTVQAFLDRKIRFTEIAQLNEDVLTSYKEQAHASLDDFLAADQWGRKEAEKRISARRV